MPKTLRNIWEEITSFENIFGAWNDARRRKRYYPQILKFGANVEENILGIQGELLHRTWRPSPWREFICREPKLRLIQAPTFADRVVHHALVRVINPAFERKFILDSYACRKGKGTLAAGERLTHFLRAAHMRAAQQRKRVYVLKADIKSYFPSISHDILMEIIQRTIGDEGALWLINQIVRDNGFDTFGLPIGAFTSQLFANVYLDVLDHYIKEELGARWYVRYMDDFVLVETDKPRLHEILTMIGVVLWERLRLRLNPKTGIFPASQGTDFAGYRHWTSFRLPRKRNIKRFRRKLRRMRRLYADGRINVAFVRARVMSFLGYTKHCKAHRTAGSALSELVLARDEE